MFKPMPTALALALFALCPAVFSQETVKDSFTCTIDATLDPLEWKIEGREEVRMRNTSSELLQGILFHLPPNARTVEEEAAGPGRLAELSRLEVLDARTAEGENRVGAVGIDGPVMSLDLVKPLAPDEAITLSISFVLKLADRTRSGCGHLGRHVDAVRWYPRPVTSGGFGEFEVSLSMPSQFIVGATGTLTDSREENSVKTYRFEAKGVRDFAWTADPLYEEEQELCGGVEIRFLGQPFTREKTSALKETAAFCMDTFGRRLIPYPHERLVISLAPYGVQKGVSSSMFIGLTQSFPAYLQSLEEHTRQPESELIRAFAELYGRDILGSEDPGEAWLGEGLSQYLYLEVMEQRYPESPVPSALIALEKKTYRFFMNRGFGLFRDPQASPSEGVCLGSWRPQQAYCNLASLVGYTKSPFFPRGRPSLLGYSVSDLMDPGWQTQCREILKASSLEAPRPVVANPRAPRVALFLRTLKNLSTPGTVDEILSLFAERSAFKNPGIKDFLAVVQERTEGMNLSWAEDYLLDDRALDFAVHAAWCLPAVEGSTEENRASSLGWGDLIRFGGPPAGQLSPHTESGEKAFQWGVEVLNHGDLVVPVTVVMTFEGGSTETREWDGRGGGITLNGTSARRLLYATVDPGASYEMDQSLLNNTRSVSLEEGGLLFLAGWTQFWIQNYLNGWAFFY